MGFFSELFGKRTQPGIGAIDVDNFDSLNTEVGRPAGDGVMTAYAQLITGLAEQTTILNEVGFRSYVVARHGGQVEGGAELLRRVGKKGFALCRPYSSGDEFILHHQDDTKVITLLSKVVGVAEQLRVPLPNAEGAVTRVLHGLPLSTGFGPTWKDAWTALLAGRKARGERASMKDRIRAATVEETLLRDSPQVDAQTGLPTTMDVLTEQTPGGLIPILMWGPVEVRRPGWTAEHEERMRWAIARHVTSKGITDAARIVEIVKEVGQLRDSAWSAVGASIMARQAGAKR